MGPMGLIGKLGAALAVLAVSASATSAGEGKLSGEMFGDMYWVAASHDSALEDQNGTWMRRVNLSYDYKYDEAWSARARLEAASPGDFASSALMTTFMKDLWLKWQSGNHSITGGLTQTPTWSLVEDVWGYRPLEKVPAELQRLASSRDLGLSFQGAFGENKRIGYHVMTGNGAGTAGETDEKKKGMAAVRVWLTETIVVEGYADYEDREESSDRYTWHAFAGYKAKSLRAGAQYIVQTRNELGGDVEIGIVSGFVTGAVSEKVWLVARVDRTLDPNPDADRIVYIPMDPTAASTFVLAAVDFRVTDGVSLMPNVEVVFYDEPDAGGSAPDTDVIPRFTFAAKF